MNIDREAGMDHKSLSRDAVPCGKLAKELTPSGLEAMKEGVIPPRPIRTPAPIRRIPAIVRYLLSIICIVLLLSRLGYWMSGLFMQKSSHTSLIQLKTLSRHLIPAANNHRRLVVVGDVHGCKDELEKLLDKVEYNKKSDLLVLTGDMIDKGPSSHGVIKLARKLGAACVRGNHEDKILALRARQDQGLSVLDAMSSEKEIAAGKVAARLSRKDIKWLQQCPLILELGKLPPLDHAASAAVVHAGLVPGISLSDQDPFAVMHMRSISKKAKGFEPSEDRDDGDPWWQVWNEEQKSLSKEDNHQSLMVLYGHDSRTGLNEHKWSLGLDSGCVGGGKLSGVVIDAKHAKVHSVHCKDER